MDIDRTGQNVTGKRPLGSFEQEQPESTKVPRVYKLAFIKNLQGVNDDQHRELDIRDHDGFKIIELLHGTSRDILKAGPGSLALAHALRGLAERCEHLNTLIKHDDVTCFCDSNFDELFDLVHECFADTPPSFKRLRLLRKTSLPLLLDFS